MKLLIKLLRKFLNRFLLVIAEITEFKVNFMVRDCHQIKRGIILKTFILIFC